MGSVHTVHCERCGWGTQYAQGSLWSSHPKGVEPALCPTCRDVVSVGVDYSAEWDVVGRACPACGGPVVQWAGSRPNEPPPCPRCGGTLHSDGVIMAD